MALYKRAISLYVVGRRNLERVREMSIATYQKLVKDCRSVLKEVNEGYYYNIDVNSKGTDYSIFTISIYDSEIDMEKKFIAVTSREFKDNTAFYLHFVRDTLANLVVKVHGKPKWIIEPCSDTSAYLMTRLNISSLDDLKDILLGGYLTKIIGGNPNKIRRIAKKKIKSLNDDVKNERSDNNRMKDKIYTQQNEINRLRNNAKYWENRARELEEREGLIAPVNYSGFVSN